MGVCELGCRTGRVSRKWCAPALPFEATAVPMPGPVEPCKLMPPPPLQSAVLALICAELCVGVLWWWCTGMCGQAGAADYMLKPLDLDELVARVERHVQRQVRWAQHAARRVPATSKPGHRTASGVRRWGRALVAEDAALAPCQCVHQPPPTHALLVTPPLTHLMGSYAKPASQHLPLVGADAVPGGNCPILALPPAPAPAACSTA